MAASTTIAKPVLDLSAIGAAIGGGLKKALFDWQVARMRCVLGELSDTQLSEIGIARKDIPAYSRKLVEDGE